VKAEVTDLCQGGVKEVCLVAQDLTAYGKDLGHRGSLPSLLSELREVEGLVWLRLLYAYPSEVNDALLSELALPPVVPYLDVPIQHVDDGVLRRMRRGYTGAQVRRLMARLRQEVPGIFIRTSLLVGHPGEDEEAFGHLVAFLKEWELDHVGVFAFSAEEGTPAATQPGAVAPDLAADRAALLMEVQRGISHKKLSALVGRRLPLLVEGSSPQTDLLRAARHAGQAPEVDGMVHLADVEEGLEMGAMVEAQVEQAADHDLVARFIQRLPGP